MSLLDRLSQPSADLSSFFRSLASRQFRYSTSDVPSHSYYNHYDAPRPTSQINLFASSLSGRTEALAILQALEHNPGCESLSVANNPLHDDGVRELVIGLKRLRFNGVGSKLREVNLSGCEISDIGLHLIVLHLLTPSPHPPTVQSLFLSNNQIQLSPWLCSFLSSTVSSPTSTLRCISFTNNPGIASAGFLAFISSLNLSRGSKLNQIHFSLCGIEHDVVDPLVTWLGDRAEGGGRALQVLCLNGNALGHDGIRKIEETVDNGDCTCLIHFEGLANDETSNRLPDAGVWETRFSSAKDRNKMALRETRTAALSLLAPARILFLPSATTPPSTPTSRQFRLYDLPPEIQSQILQSLLLLEPSSVAHLFPPNHEPSIHQSKLTSSQFLRILSYASDRGTLQTEIGVAKGSGQRVANLGRAKREWGLDMSNRRREMGGSGQEEEEDSEDGWEEWYLERVGCERFER